ncbi:MAG: hypothetical protein ACRDTU_05765 [Micromonosporaceae bacterium]
MKLFADTYFSDWELRQERPSDLNGVKSNICGIEGTLRVGIATKGYALIQLERVPDDGKAPEERARRFADQALDHACAGRDPGDYHQLDGAFDHSAGCTSKRQPGAGATVVKDLDVTSVEVAVRTTDAPAEEANTFALRAAEAMARACLTLMSKR